MLFVEKFNILKTQLQTAWFRRITFIISANFSELTLPADKYQTYFRRNILHAKKLPVLLSYHFLSDGYE